LPAFSYAVAFAFLKSRSFAQQAVSIRLRGVPWLASEQENTL